MYSGLKKFPLLPRSGKEGCHGGAGTGWFVLSEKHKQSENENKNGKNFPSCHEVERRGVTAEPGRGGLFRAGNTNRARMRIIMANDD
jgi:hypothetical protein